MKKLFIIGASALILNTCPAMAVNMMISSEEIAEIKTRNAQINALMDEFEKIKRLDLSASGIGIRDAEETAYLEKYQEQVRRYSNPTLGERAYDLISGTATVSTNAVLGLTKWGAEKTLRYGVAYLTSYYAEEFALQGVAASAGVAVTAMTLGNISAGKLAYDGVLTLGKMAQYIPGAKGAVAATVTPMVKIGTDFVIDYGPGFAVGTAKMGYKATSKVYSGVSSFVSWMSGY